ncbi:hypothetical protein LHYA1_G002829 [Lachnellula hyalina]|uniref:F-box domain-containing protein n=1 Tax=Lachnellula hyalina TaxID=1316788 RepID=A0A8H8U1Y7_9HELO|nr:uncharacterized protein LHYA1_G002829 [Lachnellula hyalina]TVY28417.1 hypothetical protein LHYA1_G002829 [Lachnellula hyalina]
MTNFRDLPSELRNRIYQLCLLEQEPIDPYSHWSPREGLTPGLLRVNKTVHREASPLFYAHNRFDFTLATPEQVASFLGTIGSNNANYIQHIHVDFPIFRDLESGNITLEEGSMGVFANIQNICTNLSTLTTHVYSTNDTVMKLDALDDPKIATEALTLVNTRFRAILSLRDINVEVYKYGPSEDIKSKMENLGWTVSATFVEEWDPAGRSFSDDADDWDRDYGYDDDDNDSYDIDNDSDFWRRAGD